MNNFKDAENDIPEQFKKDEYRFLIVANKFQTGFDQPLLHPLAPLQHPNLVHLLNL